MKSTNHPLQAHRLALFVAVSTVCCSAYAGSTPAPKSPFAPEPLHLIDLSTTTNHSSAKPNIMLFVDDSGSMDEYLPPSKTEVRPCDKSSSNDWDKWANWGRGQWRAHCWYNKDGDYVRAPYGGFKDNRTDQQKEDAKKINIVKSALTKIIENYSYAKDKNGKIDKSTSDERMHWNIMSLWGTEENGTGFTSNNSPVKQEFMTGKETLPYIEHLSPAFNTPATIRYLQSLPVVTEQIGYKCRKSFIVMLSDGDANGGSDPNFRTDLTKFLTGSSDKNLFSYLPAGYVYNDPGANNGIAYFSHKLLNADLKTQGNDDEGSLWDGKQNIQTYTVGFGRGLSLEGEQYLRDAGAAEGGAQSYFKADNEKELIEAFDKIFSGISESSAGSSTETTSIATPSNTSSPLANMAATLTLNTKIWGSELQFSEIEAGGVPKTDSSGKYITNPAQYQGRKVLMNNGQKIYWLSDNGAPNNAHDDFGFTNNNEFTGAFLPWLLRDPNKSDEQIEAYAKTLSDRTVKNYRKRTDDAKAPARQMGDVLDASVLGIGKNPKYVMTGANDGMVYIFKATSNVKAPYKLVLNYLPGGMERESTQDTLAKTLKNIAESTYTSKDNEHIYGVDGGISYVTTADTAGRQQRTLALGAMGKGGKGVYALNISGCERNNSPGVCQPVGLDADPSQWQTTVPAWESEKGAKNQLGYTIGAPRLYQLATTWSGSPAKPDTDEGVIVAGFVANGYQGKEEPTLYVYDAMGEEMGTSTTAPQSTGNKGKIIAKLKVGSGSTGTLSSPIVVDIDFDGIADIAYAGDFSGSMYRFDLRGSVSDWKVSKIYDGDSKQPITAAPAVYKVDNNNLIVVFGTGSDLFDKDRTNQDRQAFIGIYEDLTNTTPNAARKSDLLEQTLTNEGNATRTITDTDFDKSQYRGWIINLDAGKTIDNSVGSSKDIKTVSGEVAVSQPVMLLRTAFFTTRIYQSEEKSSGTGATDKETCKSSTESQKSNGTSWMMGIDVKNGGQPSAEDSAVFREASHQKKAGFNFGVMSSSPNLQSENKLDKKPFAINENGQAIDGELLTLSTGGTGKGKLKLNNSCLSRDDYFALVAKAKKEDPLASVGITGKLCPYGGRLIRINTREIKE